MNRISSELEARVVEMRLQGYSRDETARILNVGEGTVSNVWASLPRCLEPLIDLGKALRKLNLLPQDALKGVNILQLLAEHNISPEQIPIFLETMKKTSVDAGYQPEKAIQASMKLADLESKSGTSYPQAIAEFQTLTQQMPTRKKENAQLQLEIKQNTRLRNDTFEQAKTTPKEIAEYFECKTALHEYRLDIDDAKTVRKVLDNIKEAGGNAKRLVYLSKRHGSISKLVASCEKQLPTKQDELANVTSKIKELWQVILQLQVQKNQLETYINSQNSAINSNQYKLNLIAANINELEDRREGLITWIGKSLNLSQKEILKLRLTSEYEVMMAIIDNKLIDDLKTLRDA